MGSPRDSGFRRGACARFRPALDAHRGSGARLGRHA